MFLTIKGSELKLALSYIIDIFHKSGVSVGANLPIVFNAKEKVLSIVAFKDSVFVRRNIPCRAKEKGSVCVDGLLLQKLSLPAQQAKIILKNNKLDIQLPRTSYQLSVLPLHEIKIPNVEKFFTIPTELLMRSFKTISLTPRQVPELDIKCVLYKNNFKLETVDFPYVGITCVNKKIKGLDFDKKIEVTIPSSFIKTILKVNKDKDINLHVSSTRLAFVSSDTTIIQPGRQAVLPDVEENIKETLEEKPIVSIITNIKLFKEQLQSCLKFRGKSDNITAFKLKLHKDKGVIETRSDQINATSDIDIIGGPKKEKCLVLSADYTLDIVNLLTNTKSEDMKISAWDNKMILSSDNVSFIIPLMEASAAE